MTPPQPELLQQLERERARHEAESTKLADIVEAASDGIVMIAHDGIVQAWNRAMAEITGTASADAVGRSWACSLQLRDEDDVELTADGDHVVAGALRGHRHRDAVPLQVRRRDGVWRWLQVTFAPILREDAEPVGTVMVVRDVTTDREVEELKSDFVATVSHELRTPLTPLKGFVTTLHHRGGALTAEQRDVVFQAMSGQVDRLERLIGDLLVIADLDRGATRLECTTLDLRAVVDDVVAADGDGRVEIHGATHVAAAGDAGAVRHAVSALVTNAVKHTDGPVHVSVEADEDRARVHVEDRGPGIPPWDHERIFRRFHRLGDHLTRTQGPGLGLPIARALAERMGGTVEVVSDVDVGSRFTLTLQPADPLVLPDGTTRQAART